MTKSKFEKMISRRGYKPSNIYQRKDKPEFKVWQKPGSNIILEVRNFTYARVIQFQSGKLAYVEAIPFSKHQHVY